MERFIMQDLIAWKNRKDRKPLILLGARQVGKTYILKEFGQREFENVAYINCDNNALLWSKMTDNVLSGSQERRSTYDMRTEDGYKELYAELRGYEEKGVDIVMDGYPMSPLQIVTAYMAREEGTYMRDYVIDPEGRIESLVFTDVNHNRQAEITP